MPVPAPLENVTITTPELATTITVPIAIEEKEELISSQQHRERPANDMNMELESVHKDVYTIKQHPKKGKIIDNKIILDEKILQKQQKNTNIHCKVSF